MFLCIFEVHSSIEAFWKPWSSDQDQPEASSIRRFPSNMKH